MAHDLAEPIAFPPNMGELDAFLWNAERDPVLRSTAAAVALLDRPPERAALVERLRSAVREIPRLRQRVVELPRAISTPVWAADPHFDLDYHLRWVGAPRDGSFRAVLDLASSLTMQGFDPARPLWEFVVVEDLVDGRAALIQKLHHAVTDGVGGMLLMQRVYAFERRAPAPGNGGGDEGPALPAEPEEAPAEGGLLQLGAEALWRNLASRPALARRGAALALEAARHPLAAARRAATDLASIAHFLTPTLRPLSPLMRERSTRYRFERLDLPLPVLKAAAKTAGCRLNDAFLSGLAAGWRLYHEHHGAPVDALRVNVPISVRAGGGRAVAGNQLMLARIELPVGETNPRARIRRIHELVEAERAQSALAYSETTAGLLNRLPPRPLVAAFGALARSTDCVSSCVPGPPRPLFIADARVDALYTFGPPAGSAANITLFSYVDRAAIAINADPAAVPDHARLVDCMRRGFGEVVAVSPSPRRARA